VSGLLGTFADGFARRVLLEAVMVGGLCGVVGVHVLLRRLPFTMALGHATFPGVVLAALLGVNLFLGAALFGTVVVLVVAVLGAHQRVDETSAIGVILSGAFTLGVLLLSAQADFSRDLAAYLAGSIVTVQPGDLVTTALAGAPCSACSPRCTRSWCSAPSTAAGWPPSATRCSPWTSPCCCSR
jgi:ABC-type Mn2+/Zn2+ transport system permease subunit